MNTLANKLGWVILFIGALFFGIAGFLIILELDSTVPIFLKLGIGSAIIGFLLMIGGAIYEALSEY